MRRARVYAEGVLLIAVTAVLWPLYRWPKWLDRWESRWMWDSYRAGIDD